MSFKDLFSQLAPDYTKYRPHYPDELFDYLASITACQDRAWDCGTGSGQAALGLARRFKQVIATDASEKQISNAVKHERIIYRVAYAENVDIQSESIDLVTVAQALHWFDFDGFYKEVKRVLKPGGAIAAWTYRFMHISEPIDNFLKEFHEEFIKKFWSPEIRYTGKEFQSLPFPFKELQPPQMNMEARWTMYHLMGFLGTWSAVQKYKEINGADPLKAIAEDLKARWGDPETERTVRWPLMMRVGHV